MSAQSKDEINIGNYEDCWREEWSGELEGEREGEDGNDWKPLEGGLDRRGNLNTYSLEALREE